MNKEQLLNRTDLSIDEIRKVIQNKSYTKSISILCGEFINSGVYRDVYVCKLNPKFVIKIEKDPSICVFSNVNEWINYVNTTEWREFNRWLAPCRMINETGTILIQDRVYHKKRKDYPKYIPNILTDTKLSNYGWIEDNFVCCDYPTFIQSGYKMKYVKWIGTLKGINGK